MIPEEAKVGLLCTVLFSLITIGFLYEDNEIKQRNAARFYNSLPIDVREACQRVDRNRNGILEQSELEELSRLYDIRAKDYGLR